MFSVGTPGTQLSFEAEVPKDGIYSVFPVCSHYLKELKGLASVVFPVCSQCPKIGVPSVPTGFCGVPSEPPKLAQLWCSQCSQCSHRKYKALTFLAKKPVTLKLTIKSREYFEADERPEVVKKWSP